MDILLPTINFSTFMIYIGFTFFIYMFLLIIATKHENSRKLDPTPDRALMKKLDNCIIVTKDGHFRDDECSYHPNSRNNCFRKHGQELRQSHFKGCIIFNTLNNIYLESECQFMSDGVIFRDHGKNTIVLTV